MPKNQRLFIPLADVMPFAQAKIAGMDEKRGFMPNRRRHTK
jgi:hypothetical protein